MREEHPIDERFSALYGAESTPPDAVRTALSARLGWSGASAGWGLWRPWLIAGASVLVVCLFIAHGLNGTDPVQTVPFADTRITQEHTSTSDREVADKDIPEPQEATENASMRASDAGRTSGTTATTPQRIQSTDEGSVGLNGAQPVPTFTSTTLAKIKPPKGAGTPDRPRANENSPRTGLPEANTRPVAATGQARASIMENRAEGDVADGIGSLQDGPSSGISMGAPGSAAGAIILPDAAAVPMMPLTMDMEPKLDAGTPVPGTLKIPYVLTRGTWWIAPYISMGPVRGQWKGNGANDLIDAEDWRSSTQGGLLAGLTWQSGWSVSAGLGLSRIHSSFEYKGTNGTEEYTAVDTTWTPTPYADTPYTLYTWTIDSLVGTRPGATVQRDSRNQYTTVQVPLTLSWHTAIRRFNYGAFGGISAWIPTKRSGLTLVRPAPDALPSVADLSDPSTDARIQAQIHGRLGLSVGYSISEFLGIYAEPMVSTPLMVFDKEATPWLTQPALQLRLQYEFPSTR